MCCFEKIPFSLWFGVLIGIRECQTLDLRNSTGKFIWAPGAFCGVLLGLGGVLIVWFVGFFHLTIEFTFRRVNGLVSLM